MPTLLYYLVRLLHAANTPGELSAAQRRGLATRLDALWRACYTRPHLRSGRCPTLVEHLLPALLEHDCCCQAVRRFVSLDEALYRGFRVRRWAIGLRRRAAVAYAC